MIRGLYSAASALVAAEERQEVASYNLANASTTGYRQRGVASETFDRVLNRTQAATGDLTGTRVGSAYSDFRPGLHQQTGHPYDLALGDPDRFFVLAGPDGPLYTRNGAFTPSATGQLVSQAGYPLQAELGPLTFPANTTQLNIATDGSVTADGVPVGRVQLARVANPGQLIALGPTLYSARPEAGAVPAEGRVLQGFREGSNVQPADAMVQMIIGSRYYEAAQRAIRTIAESIQLNTRPS